MAIMMMFVSNIARADYVYTLIDTQDNFTVTYDSSQLITSELDNAPVTSSTNSNIVSMSFIPDYTFVLIPHSGGGGQAPSGNGNIVVTDAFTSTPGDLLVVNTSSGSAYNGYAFSQGAFNSLGDYQAPFSSRIEGYTHTGELVVTPEPKQYGLFFIMAVLGYGVFRRTWGARLSTRYKSQPNS